MRKVKFIIAAASMLVLVSGSAAYADGFAPGEGLYVGFFGGHGAGNVTAKATVNEKIVDSGDATGNKTTSVDLTDGGIGLSGAIGGGWLGYGYKMGPLYAGFEWDFSAGGEKFKATCAGTGCQIGQINRPGGRQTITSIEAKVEWNTSGGGRIGYYLNPNTLLAIRGGIAATKFDVSTNNDSATVYGGGPAFAASIQSTLTDIDPNLSIRMEYLFVDYLDASVTGWGDTMTGTTGAAHNDYHVSGQVYQGRLGLAYSFFDVNTLF